MHSFSTHDKAQCGCADKEAMRTRCEVWTRVMGYHRPVSQFNPGKRSEHYERHHFHEMKSFASTFAR